MKGHIEGSPVPPNQKNPALSPVLNEVILMAMARDPAHRYQTAEEFRSALLNVKEQTRFRAAAVPGPSHVANSVVPPVTAAQPPIPAAATVVTRSGAHAAPPAAATSVPATPAYATQAPVAPASSSMPVAPAAIAPVPRSYRAFYIAVGSALTILLILFTAMKLPMLHSSESVSKSAPAATPGSPAPPAGGAAAPGQPAAGAQPIPGSVVAQPPAPNTLVPSASSPDASSGGAIARRNPAVQQQNSAQSAAAAEAARKEEEARKAAEAAAAENARLLEEQENRFAHMTARANSIKDSFENLRRQQAAAGYSPDSSISTAVHTMEGFLSRADAALSNRDGTAARKFMDQAETQLQILERRFGR
jgi:serine/threonine-protein kinase